MLCEYGNTADVGANKGEYTKEMSLYSKNVYAFEPIPKLYFALSRKRFLKKNVYLYQTALSDTEQIKDLHIPIFKSRFHKNYSLDAMASIDSHDFNSKMYVGENVIQVETRTLDSFQFDISFMKIDVEGHELSVLRGAEKTIERCKPHLLLEIEDRYGNDINKVSECLENKGYKGFFIYNNELKQLCDFDVDLMQRLPLKKINHRPSSSIDGYVNNFMFFHESKNIVDSINDFLKYLK